MPKNAQTPPRTDSAWLRNRWDRLARFYDRTHLKPEWRRRICDQARGKTLEVGAGTGLNLPYYHREVDLTLIDLSDGMLELARERAGKLGRQVKIRQMDVEHLDFSANSFDTITATCVFCTVPDPVQGLSEIRRVCRPDGQVLLLEHVRSCSAVLGPLMDLINPIPRALIGTSINRRTVDNIKAAGLEIVSVEKLWRDIVLAVTAQPAK